MTFWTGFYADLLILGSTSYCICVSTWTSNWNLFIVWVNSWFHNNEWLRVGCDRSISVWERYECLFVFFMAKYETNNGGPGRDRTYEGVSQRIYSPPHLTTLVPTQNLEPPIRLELMTAGLQNRCSTNWAKVACEADCIKNDCLVKIFLYNMTYDSYNSHLRWWETLLWSDFRISEASHKKYRNTHY